MPGNPQTCCMRRVQRGAMKALAPGLAPAAAPIWRMKHNRTRTRQDSHDRAGAQPEVRLQVLEVINT